MKTYHHSDVLLTPPSGTQPGDQDVDGRSGAAVDQQCPNTQSLCGTTLSATTLTD